MYFIALLVGLTSQPAALRIDAQQFWNLKDLRLPDDRDAVVVLFRKSERDWLLEQAPQLRRIGHRAFVAAVTPDSPEQVGPWLANHRLPAVPVGAGSHLAARLGITHWPAVVLWRGGRLRVVQGPQRSRQVLRYWTGRRGLPQRLEELRNLRQKLPARQFVELCRDLLASPPPPGYEHWAKQGLWYGDVAWMAQDADPDVPDKDKQPRLSGYDTALESISVAEQALVDAYRLSAADKPVGRLVQDYLIHLGDAPVDLLIRDAIQRALNEPTDARPADACLAAVLQLLPLGTDSFLRMDLARACAWLCERYGADPAPAVDLLEDLVVQEKDVRVQAMMYAALDRLYQLEDKP